MCKAPLRPDKRNEENNLHAVHRCPEGHAGLPPILSTMGSQFHRAIYEQSDLALLQSTPAPRSTYIHSLSSIDELLERDVQREKDGFPRKIRIGRLVKPGRGEKDKIIVVPSTVEEKFLHDMRDEDPEKEDASGGSGEGQEGDVIGEEQVHGTDGTGEGGAGQGEGGQHEIESSAYDLGKILTEKFELPNLKEKGKRRSLTRYTYDLTDRHQGFGQLLDKKATLRKILETNVNLNNIPTPEMVDPTELIVSPRDMVYRVLSKEKDYESQAVVFFLRDYSGSMTGKPTEIVVAQHVLIYSWLLYQYDKQVDTRFILHDTEAKEVDDFYTYYNSTVAGGTRVLSAYRLVNEIVEGENLERDYNIYVFHGTDGDDWDTDGAKTISEIRKMLSYSNRIGITIAEGMSTQTGGTAVEKVVRNAGVLDEFPDRIRLDNQPEDFSEARLIDGIKRLIS